MRWWRSPQQPRRARSFDDEHRSLDRFDLRRRDGSLETERHDLLADVHGEVAIRNPRQRRVLENSRSLVQRDVEQCERVVDRRRRLGELQHFGRVEAHSPSNVRRDLAAELQIAFTKPVPVLGERVARAVVDLDETVDLHRRKAVRDGDGILGLQLF